MNGPAHDAAHEALLAEVLVGERDAGAEEVQALTRQCATCREELEALLQLQSALHSEAEEERLARLAPQSTDEPDVATLLTAIASGAAAGELPAAAQDSVPGHRPAAATTRPAPAVPWWIPLAALLVIAVSLTLALRGGSGPSSTRPSLLLGHDPDQRLHDVETAVPGQLTFRWEDDLADGARYEIRVWDADRPALGTWRQQLDWPRREWTLQCDDAARPARVRWQVLGFDVFGHEQLRAERVQRLRDP